MSVIKSYTDLEQSKKLSEILPIESADMVYTGEKENLVNACYETIVKLKELNLI